MSKLTRIKECFVWMFKFIKDIPGYFKLYQWYGYEPETYDFIIFHYEKVLSNRTKRMSKPTYHCKEVISELDEYYEDVYKDEINRLEKEIEKLEKTLDK